MNKNNIIELSKICSNNSVLVVNKLGVYRLFCPFKAVCIVGVQSYIVGQEVTVIAVKMSNDYKLVYVIQNKGYYHHYFMITSTPTAIQTTFN
jgi:hypothetical protein